MKLTINVRTIPHTRQRYETVGDWHYEIADDELLITAWISEQPNIHHLMLLATHEITEALLCYVNGVRPDLVTAWDKGWSGPGEPGDAPLCPYRKEHQTAELLERLMAQALCVDWSSYLTLLELNDATSRN